MDNSLDKIKSFSRRTVVLGIGKGCLLTALIGRLYYLQNYEGQQYNLLSDKNRIRTRFIMPARGTIYDRNNLELAVDKPAYSMCLLLDDVDNLNETLTNYQQLLNIPPAEIQQLKQALKKHSKHIPWVLNSNLSWDDVARIEAHRHHLPGIFTEKSHNRYYPYDKYAAHLLGYVGAYNSDTAKPTTFQLSGSKEGKAGIERANNEHLRGVPGSVDLEVDACGQIMRQLSRHNSVPGKNIRLTINASLQKFIHEQFNNYKSGSAVVLNVHTGEVLALVSTPSYDPNLLINNNDTKYWRQLLTNPFKPLINRPLTGLYHPGSSFKLVVALAALENNTITQHDKINCIGYYDLNQHRYNCMRCHGWLNLSEAIMSSCDTFFYTLAKQIGIEQIHATAKMLGLGQPYPDSGLETKVGTIPNKEWMRQRYKREWTPAYTILSSIGQGFVLSNPLELAVLAARLGNRHFKITPQIYCQDHQPEFSRLAIKQKNLEIILQAMFNTVNHPQGTAYNARIYDAKYTMIGKTSTSQNRSISKQERAHGLHRQQHLLKWNERDDSIFIGLAPAVSPRLAISVVCDHAGVPGSRAAAPIARDVLLYAQKELGL